MYDLTTKIAAVCEMAWEDLVDVAPERIGQDSLYWPDATKLRALGWRPCVYLQHGLVDMLRWVKKYPELLTTDTTFRLRP